MPQSKLELKIDSVYHAYRGKQVLRGAWLNCKEGEVVGVLGRNGCGKSTLLKILFGQLKAQQATVKVDQVWVDQPYLEPGLMAYLPQGPLLPDRIKVARALRILIADPKMRAEIMHDPMVLPHLKQRAKTLSGGERRYLEVRIVLGLQRYFCILDEPFTGIEPRYIEKIKTLIFQTQNQGIVITDHLYPHILALSDRLFVIKGGQSYEAQNRADLVRLGYIL